MPYVRLRCEFPIHLAALVCLTLSSLTLLGFIFIIIIFLLTKCDIKIAFLQQQKRS